MSIEKMLVISTSNITRETAHALDHPDPMETLELIVHPHGNYGWLIVVPPREDTPTLPGCMRTALEQARCEGCDWLLIDRDGPVHNLLQEYEW